MKHDRLTRFLTPDRRTILGNSSYVVATTLATAILGFVYWWIAARRFSPGAVGVAATAVSAMTLLGFVGMLGFGTLLIAEVHRRGERAVAYIATGILVSGTTGVVLGLIAILAAPLFSPDLTSFAHETSALVLFPLGVGLTAATLVADQALIGLLRSGTQFTRNVVFAASKLGLLTLVGFAAAGATAIAIFSTWVAGLVISVLVVAVVALRVERRLARYRPDTEIVRHLGRGMLEHHAMNMAVQAPSLALTVVVTTMLGATAGGYYYVASMIAGFVSVAAPALGITLFAVGARSPDRLSQSIRLTLAVSFVVTAAGVIAVVVAAPWLLGAFGAGYAREATLTLIYLSLATLPGIVKTHFIQVQRIAGRVGWGAGIATIGAIAELGAATIGAKEGGLVGLSQAFALALLVEAALMSPTVLRAAGIRRGGVAVPLGAGAVLPGPGEER